MFKWNILSQDDHIAEKISKSLKISKFAAKLLVIRGITNQFEAQKFLFGTLADLEDPHLLKDLSLALEIILKALKNKEKIAVFGDYDVDGVTATSLVVSALRDCAAQVIYYIPHRLEEGYGISQEGIDWAKKNKVNLIITVDNGISNFSQVKLIKDLGIKIIITDHHEVLEEIPQADAVINPKRKDCLYPHKNLSGAGVAFKLIQALFKNLNKDFTKFLDLAALGTVADCVSVLGENRLLIKDGLKKIKENPNLGIKALLETASFLKEVDCGALSFILAPRINAAGRMNKAELAVELMLEENFTQAKILAEKLNQYNRERQEEEAQIYKDIEKKLYLNPALLEEEILFLSSRHWHLGIIGIVASRITEKIKRPVFLACADEEIIKGSARTKGNCNIFEMLFNCKDLLENFGGHQNAGGFSLKKNKLEDFKNKLKDLSKNYPKVKDELNIDLELNFKDINLNLIKELELLAPFGQGNSPPLFLTKAIEISEQKLVGKPALHVRANFKQDGILYPAIGFRKNEYFKSIKSEFHYDLVYNLKLEYFQNSFNIKLEWQDLKLPDKICYILLKEPQQVYHQKNKEFQIIDARLLIDKSKYLKNILEHTPQGLILVRNFKEIENFDFLEEKFLNEIKKNAFMKGEERILVAPICQNENLGDKIFDLVYLHPPLSLEELVLKIKKINNLQIHFLFHYNELEKEKKIQEILAPPREKLIKIYSQLKRLTKEHFKVHLDYPKLVKLINDPLIQEITIKTALIIFKELDLLEFLTEREKTWIILKEKSQNDLNNSKYFLKVSAKKKTFYELEKLIKLPKLEALKQKLI